MRLAASVLMLVSAAAAHAQTPADSLRRLPEFRIPLPGDFQPPQTSAVRAGVYSVATTAGLVGAGALVLTSAPPFGDDDTLSPSGIVGVVLVTTGVLVGPLVGNLSLGAGATARRTVGFVGAGFAGGCILAVAGAGTLVLDLLVGPGTDAPGRLAIPLFVSAGVVVAAGVSAATVCGLATIPGNARWARRARAAGNRVPVAVWPGYDVRGGGPVLAVRVDL